MNLNNLFKKYFVYIYYFALIGTLLFVSLSFSQDKFSKLIIDKLGAAILLITFYVVVTIIFIHVIRDRYYKMKEYTEKNFPDEAKTFRDIIPIATGLNSALFLLFFPAKSYLFLVKKENIIGRDAKSLIRLIQICYLQFIFVAIIVTIISML